MTGGDVLLFGRTYSPPSAGGGAGGASGAPLYLSPLGSLADDGPQIQAALTANAYVRPVVLRAGTYFVDNPINMPSGAVLQGGPGVYVVSRITPTPAESPNYGSPIQSMFRALPPSYSVMTELAAPAATGSRTITVVDSTLLFAGDEIALTNGNLTAGYVVLEVDNSTGTLTLEREVLYPFPTAGTSVIDRLAPKDIQLLADGMLVTGTGDAVVEWSGAWRCLVRGLIVSPRSGVVDFQNVVVNFDVGSRECRLERCYLDGAGNSDSIWHFESAEHCVAFQIRARGAVNRAWFLTAGYGCAVYSCTAERSGVGAGIEAADSTRGARAAVIQGCSFFANTGTGLVIQNACERVTVTGCHASYNGGTGFAVGGGTGPSTDVTLDGCHANDNTGAGFYIIAGARDIHVQGCTADRCNSFGFEGEGEWDAVGIASRDCRLGGVRVGVGGRASVVQAQLAATQDTTAAAWAGFTQQSTDARALRILDARVEMSGAGTKSAISSQASGTTHADNLVSVGGTFGWVASAGVLVMGSRLNLDSAATPFSGGTLRSASPVLVSFANSAHATTSTRYLDPFNSPNAAGTSVRPFVLPPMGASSYDVLGFEYSNTGIGTANADGSYAVTLCTVASDVATATAITATVDADATRRVSATGRVNLTAGSEIAVQSVASGTISASPSNPRVTVILHPRA